MVYTLKHVVTHTFQPMITSLTTFWTRYEKLHQLLLSIQFPHPLDLQQGTCKVEDRGVLVMLSIVNAAGKKKKAWGGICWAPPFHARQVCATSRFHHQLTLLDIHSTHSIIAVHSYIST